MGRKGPAPGTGGRPVELPGALGILARAAGGTGPLAEKVGVSPRTLQRWGKKRPPKRIRMLLELVAEDYRLPRAIRRQLADFDPAVTLDLATFPRDPRATRGPQQPARRPRPTR
jgi:hypothetical protein